MENLYDSPEGQELLEKTQGVPERVWNIIKCRCGLKYNMCYVRWHDGSPVCPRCGRTS